MTLRSTDNLAVAVTREILECVLAVTHVKCVLTDRVPIQDIVCGAEHPRATPTGGAVT